MIKNLIKSILFLIVANGNINIASDPTRPPNIEKVSNIDHTVVLKAILSNENDMSCLINKTLYKENDKVMRFTITKITDTHVLLIDDNKQEFELYI